MVAASGRFPRICEHCGRLLTTAAGWAKHRPDGGRGRAVELELLGAPLPPDGVGAAIEKKTTAISLLTSRLSLLAAHQTRFLLKNCLAASKMIHFLRCSLTLTRLDKLVKFETLIRDSLVAITNTEMFDAGWMQASL
ncbi:hypothetical protein BV898_13088 [Hypsibius exemplaris]|uniref:Uncharacterized protein n=1 Tax=Hypsibius exemplaris TaxID=2072580 RepID=A0A1W0WBX4_HYPEX|nr:hypothetical protein BV898_13088 [Hypsibius exemplaris]